MGISNIATSQKRTIYVNTTDISRVSEFMNESDNVRSLRNIRNFVMTPMIDDYG